MECEWEGKRGKKKQNKTKQIYSCNYKYIAVLRDEFIKLMLSFNQFCIYNYIPPTFQLVGFGIFVC